MEDLAMNWIFWMIIALFIIYFIRQSLAVKGVSNTSVEQLESVIDDQDKQFIDVRTPMEYNHDKIRPFKNIPLRRLRQQSEKQLDKNKEVVLICRSGSPSLPAARILKREGFTKITNVTGGMNYWTG